LNPESAPAGYPDPDVRPIVRTAPAGNRTLWIFGAVMPLVALLLFEALSARRERLTEPATQIMPSNDAMVTAPPPLTLPPQFREGAPEQGPLALQAPLAPARSFPAPPPAVVTRIVGRPVPSRNLTGAPPANFLPQPVVIQAPPLATAPPPSQAAPAVTNDRILAGHLRNPSFTVPQGAVIAAVLETALDSTRPGGVRAIVQRDVMGFDGTRVLIPRGSRLYGEYGSDVGAGQKRALIHWTRLTRPDAVIMNLDSPSADPLGRAGVEGKVNSHFFERFGGAILQSVLDIGVGLATRSVTDNGVLLAIPTSAQTVTGVQPPQVTPTLKVKQGTSVSVFVARDLDFSSVDQ